LRRKLWRSAAAGALAVALSITGTGTRANAVGVDPYSIIAEIGIQLLSRAFSGGGGVSEAELAQAVAQITAKIEQTKVEIINHIDAVASAEVQACARANTIEFASINSMSRTVLQLWAQSATTCATKATAYLNALTSPQAVDNIGWLVGEIFTIVIAARTKAGLVEGLDLVRQDEISAFNAVESKLTPACCVIRNYWTPSPDGGPPLDQTIYYTYTAYNGDTGTTYAYYFRGQLRVEPNHTGASNEAARNTSRSLAQQALPTLRSL